MAKLVVMLRVKDGIQFVHEWLSCFEKFADEVVVLDNGSTDGTDMVLAAHPKVTGFIRTEGFNEGRDKNLLYDLMRSRRPDWCIWVDIDEVFEPNLTRGDFDKLMKSRFVKQYAFRRFHFIDRENFAGSWFRLNYSAGHDRIMWREQPGGYFENKILDSPNVKGIKGWKAGTNFRLKHLGYIDKALVDKKAELYRAYIEPGNEANINTMYMQHERRIRWEDKRNHPRVLLINGVLDFLLLQQYSWKAFARIKNLVFNHSKTS